MSPVFHLIMNYPKVIKRTAQFIVNYYIITDTGTFLKKMILV